MPVTPYFRMIENPHTVQLAVRVAVHQPPLDRTLAVWLDSAPDLSCTDSTQDYWVDVEHQPNGVGSQLVGVVIAEVWGWRSAGG